MECSLPGSSVHGIFQARVLEWVDKGYLLILVTTLGSAFTLLSPDEEPFWVEYNNDQVLGDMLYVYAS